VTTEVVIARGGSGGLYAAMMPGAQPDETPGQ
jgi:hypothetical protein